MKDFLTIILCRFSSSRLPGKILVNLGGDTILGHIYTRISGFIDPEHILVATSDDTSDDIIEAYCKEKNIACFRGDLNDVAGRFLNAAKSGNYKYATRINGDNLFIDLDTYQEMVEIMQSGKYKFVTNVKGRTFPFGMSIEIVDINYYEKIYQNLDTDHYREHVTLYLYDHPDEVLHFYHYNTKYPEAAGLKMAVDTEEDFQKAQLLFSKLKDKNNYSLEEIIKLKTIYAI